MISAEGFWFSYPGAKTQALRNVSLEIEKGDFLAIIGGNGCGKSTLCKAMIGLMPHFFSSAHEGVARINGVDTNRLRVGETSRTVGYVHQDFENQIVCPTVLEDASFSCLNFALENYLEIGMNALRMVGLSKKSSDYVWQLSGCQKHLLALSGALALSPEAMIIGEPAAQLDPKHAATICERYADSMSTWV
jgi:energy-coupling factor transport system ATP-binding protein